MKEAFGVATEEDILQLEAQLTEMLSVKSCQGQTAIVLPNDYKSFLTETNGGHPKKDFFQHKNFGISVVHLYYGINFPEYDYRSLLDATLSMRSMGEAFNSVIGIATDPSGLCICLDIGSSNYGKVFLFVHDSSCADDANPLLCVSDSFTEFFYGCYETDEEVEAAYTQARQQK